MAEIVVPRVTFAAASGFGAVWATSTEAGVVSRIDPATNRVVARPSRPGAAVPRSRARAVWMLNHGDGTVSQIDPASERVTATIALRVPGQGG